jgi:hypothetical protein
MDTVFFDPDGSENYPAITAVEGLLGGVGRLVFPDGTMQFAENDTYPEIIFSPRLTEPELEAFCQSNMDRYEAYFEVNFEAIDEGGDLPPIERFWEVQSQ